LDPNIVPCFAITSFVTKISPAVAPTIALVEFFVARAAASNRHSICFEFVADSVLSVSAFSLCEPKLLTEYGGCIIVVPSVMATDRILA